MFSNKADGRSLSISLDAHSLSIIVFSLFSAWTLSFLFEGQVLYAICDLYQLDPHTMIFGSITALFTGLLACGVFIKSMQAARRLMRFAFLLGIAGTVTFLFTPSIIWTILHPAMSFLAGSCIAAWGFFFKNFTPSDQRIQTAADVLIYSNVLMIVINMVAINLSPCAGLALSIFMLSGALFFAAKLPGEGDKKTQSLAESGTEPASPAKALALLCLFILIITINSGLMYQVINPAFAHHVWLVSWYWAIPYVIALYVMKTLPRKTNRAYILYVAIAMMGFAFISFMTFDRSAASYLLVDTLMLGACGVYDLFWWSILGEMLDFDKNPAKILGIGLSANVLGVLFGDMLGKTITASDFQAQNSAVFAFGVIFVSLLILPLLHKQLSTLLKSHAYLTALSEMPAGKQAEAVMSVAVTGQLTAREREIAELLVRGRTYKMIADELFLSENTIKSHIKNIYSKLGIKRKSELIILMMENPPADK